MMRYYNVPVIQHDLRHEETIIQAANALEYLTNVINDVFDRIDARIEANNNRMDRINERISVANCKVGKLVGINKALNIFSPAKYPELNEDSNKIPVTFTRDTCSTIHYNNDYHVTSNLDPVNHKNIQEKLQFYHVKTKSKHRIQMAEILSQPEGLGEPPSNIKSVDSLFLFNTVQNLYENYKNVDPLLEDGRPSASQIVSAKGEIIEAAPLSISNRDTNKSFVEDLLYAPGVNEAPALDVPIDLPDLPGIADDIAFDLNQLDEKIAPSHFRVSNIHNLPNLPEPIEICENVESADIPKPPPPPPAAPAEVVAAQKDITSIQTTSLPPPPPPPPPPQILGSESTQTDSKPQTTISAPEPVPVASGGDSARMNLMEAIRKAGGKSKLRAAAPQPTISSSAGDDPNDKPKPVAGGDLMADLHNKLLMRRKGISGAKGADSGSVMDKVSAMIPPPPKPGVNNQSSNTEPSDDDWE